VRAGFSSPSSSGCLVFPLRRISGAATTAFPYPISSDPIQIFGIGITPLEISVAIGVFAIMGLIELFKRKTLLGKAFEAVSADRCG